MGQGLSSLGGLAPAEMPMAPSLADSAPDTDEMRDAAAAGGAMGQITQVGEEAEATPGAAAASPDIGQIADQVFEQVKQRLIIERERMGGPF